MSKYDDMLNMKAHVSKKHPRLSKEQHAAQFLPFKALTGFEDEIADSSLISLDMKSLTEDESNKINKIITYIINNIDKKPYVYVTCYEKNNKNIGIYKNIEGYSRSVNPELRFLMLDNKVKISFDSIIDIKIDC